MFLGIVASYRTASVDTAPGGIHEGMTENLARASVYRGIVRVLDISGNPLRVLPRSMHHMCSLRELHANGCGLTELPDLSGLPLENVRVAGNNLAKIPDWLEFRVLDSRTRLYDFSGNPLAKPLEFIAERYDGLR